MILAHALMVLSCKVEKQRILLSAFATNLEKCTQLHSGASIFEQCLKRLWPTWGILVSSKTGQKGNKTSEFIICMHSNGKRMAKGQRWEP